MLGSLSLGRVETNNGGTSFGVAATSISSLTATDQENGKKISAKKVTSANISAQLAKLGFGLADFVGNGWEWTNTLFAAFPGFEPFSFYQGYSANFFDNQHYVMKGGSMRTAACLTRPSFRNWFQPHYPHVYACFRCVKS